MNINLEYLTPLTIEALYNVIVTAYDNSDDVAEMVELNRVMELLNDAYIGLTGEAL